MPPSPGSRQLLFSPIAANRTARFVQSGMTPIRAESIRLARWMPIMFPPGTRVATARQTTAKCCAPRIIEQRATGRTSSVEGGNNSVGGDCFHRKARKYATFEPQSSASHQLTYHTRLRGRDCRGFLISSSCALERVRPWYACPYQYLTISRAALPRSASPSRSPLYPALASISFSHAHCSLVGSASISL